MASFVFDDYTVKKKPEKISMETDEGILESEQKKWGLPLKQVYKLSLSFFKEHDGRELQLSYDDRLNMVAFTRQAAVGPLAKVEPTPLGVLDVVGRDRRNAWQNLGSISQIQAMAAFINGVNRHSTIFRQFIEAERAKHEEEQRRQLQEALDHQAHATMEQRVAQESQRDANDKDDVLTRAKEELNEQTFQQFLDYSTEQYPGNCDQQALLVRQLQDHHFQAYLRQVAKNNTQADTQLTEEIDQLSQEVVQMSVGRPGDSMETFAGSLSDSSSRTVQTVLTEGQPQAEEDDETDEEFPVLESATMWTVPEIVPFKESARANDCKLVVGQGETVTVRVPTTPRATCVAWQFATDSYDVGFGVYFEWSVPTSNAVTVYVSDSDEDEEEEDDPENDLASEGSDPERGAGHERAALARNKPPVTVIAPMFRRDSHTEVYAGTHKIPCEGTYLLKFDNTFSMWRSKTVYYKVHYYYDDEE